ncbi:MAG: hypothetical protein R3B89_09170 [Polyangiaceae bacterium]
MKANAGSYSLLGGACILALLVAHGCSGADANPGTNIGKNDAGGGRDGSPSDSGFIDANIDPDPKCLDPEDSDGDTIADDIEGEGDTDGDGTPDKLDLDSDDDGIPDEEEAVNPDLPAGKGGQRTDPCSPVANSDDDEDGYDFQDNDSDGDGVPDDDEVTGCATNCRVHGDCDEDDVIDLVESAAGSDPCDASSLPTDASLYFIVPYNGGPKTQRFSFSTGIKDADIYFMVDTTKSMQPAIDNVKASLDTKIIPTILNGNAAAKPPIPAIPGAYVGAGAFEDVPWNPYGNTGDQPFQNRFCIGGTGTTCDGGSFVDGSISAPVDNAGSFVAPDNVRSVIDSLSADGGLDGPEAATQALFMAVDSSPIAFTGGGVWSPTAANCDPGLLGRVCFRPGKLPIFVLISDAQFHNGPVATNDYDSQIAGGAKSYAEVVSAMNAIGAKIVGVPVQTGGGGSAAGTRTDMVDLAQKTGSLYFDPSFGGREEPLVNDPTPNGSVADEVVRLIGLLAGQGLNNVTTRTNSYDCPGNVDCDGNGTPDPEFHNVIDKDTSQPFDATKLIESVTPVASMDSPLPYSTIDATTFYGVRGDKTVEFEVTAENQAIKPEVLTVLRAILRVQTPGGQALGGPDGIKVIYLVVPRYVQRVN